VPAWGGGTIGGAQGAPPNRCMQKVRQQLYDLLERESPIDAIAKAIHGGLVALILVNVVTSVLDTVASINAVYGRLFDQIEIVSLAVFTVEYCARVWVAPENPYYADRGGLAARAAWMMSAAGIIDLVAIIPFILGQLFDVDLHVIILLRLLRFYKIARYSTGFNSLIMALRSERHALAACLLILITMVLTSAGLMSVFEHEAQPDKFGSIPESMWWAFATVTTVGYGDVVPVTIAGRIVGVITMITGLVMVALPAGIVASAFATNISRNNFVATAGMLSRIKLFAGMEVSMLLSMLPNVATRTFERDVQIIHWGGRAAMLYCVVDGEVEIDQARRRRRAGPGDAFGGVIGPYRDLSARAATRVKVMLIEEREVYQLCRSLPDFAERLVTVVPGERRRKETEHLIRRRFQRDSGPHKIAGKRPRVRRASPART
jgi:voltage-gated potassium channel